MVIENMSDYDNFKKKVIEKVTEKLSEEKVLERILPRFEETIGSRRSYQQIQQSKSLAKFFECLEFRDELAEDRIQAIKTVVDLIGCEEVKYLIITQYEKLKPQIDCCRQCGKNNQSEGIKPIISSKVPVENHYIDEPSDSDDEEPEIDIAIRKIASRIGRKWTDIARSLKLTEPEIDEIDYDYQRLAEKIYKMFGKWKENCGPKATVAVLRRALKKSRRCDLADMI